MQKITITVLGQPVTINDNEEDIVRYVYGRVLENGPSVNRRGTCQYRHEGVACAAGYCIDDSLIGSEGQQIDKYLTGFKEDETNENIVFLRKHVDLFTKLQTIHDSYAVYGKGSDFTREYSFRMTSSFPYLSDKSK